MIQRNEAYKRLYNPKDLCAKPFCSNYKIPDDLGLCNECLNDLTSLIGLKEIYEDILKPKRPKHLAELRSIAAALG